MKKEYNILNYFNMRSLFLGVGLSKILIDAKELFWLALILGTILGILIFNTFSKIIFFAEQLHEIVIGFP